MSPITPHEPLDKSLDRALFSSLAFRDRYAGKVGALDESGLSSLLDELGAIHASVQMLSLYISVMAAADTAAAVPKDAAARADDVAADLDEALQFFNFEWVALSDDRAARLLEDRRLAPYRNLLVRLRRFKPYLITPQVEEVLARRDAAASDAWIGLYDRIVGSLRIELGGTARTVDQLIALRRAEDRSVRQQALDAQAELFGSHQHTLAHALDTLVADRLTVDELRGLPTPRSERDLENDLSSAAVDRLLAAVEARYDLARTWFRHKAAILSVPKLTSTDEHAPVCRSARDWSLPAALDTIVGAFDELSCEVGDIVRRLIDERHIDAPPRAGKLGNAMCFVGAPSQLPYVLVNFTGAIADVVKLAHEIGHAVHAALSLRHQPFLSAEAPVAASEIPALFAELMVMERLAQEDEGARQEIAVGRLEAALDAAFRQTVVTRFEEAAYSDRAAGKRLSADRLCALWMEQSRMYYGDAVELPSSYRLDWMRISHLWRERFYNYAYVFAQLTCLRLNIDYRQDPSVCAERFIAFLRLGGSRPLEELIAHLGLEMEAADCWAPSFEELSRLRDEAIAATTIPLHELPAG